MSPPSPSLLSLPDDVLSLIFSLLHTSTPGNAAFDLAQCSRSLLSVFARTSLLRLRHDPHASCRHTAALLRVAGPHLTAFSLEESGKAQPSAPALLDALAIYCRRVQVLEMDACGAHAAPVLVRRVLHACVQLREITLHNPTVEVLKVVVRSGGDAGRGKGLRRVLLRFDEAADDVLSAVSSAIGRRVWQLELEWWNFVTRCNGDSEEFGVVGSVDGVSEAVDDELRLAGNSLMTLCSRPTRSLPTRCRPQAVSVLLGSTGRTSRACRGQRGSRHLRVDTKATLKCIDAVVEHSAERINVEGPRFVPASSSS